MQLHAIESYLPDLRNRGFRLKHPVSYRINGPTRPEYITRCESSLGTRLPHELKELLLEADGLGIVFHYVNAQSLHAGPVWGIDLYSVADIMANHAYYQKEIAKHLRHPPQIVPIANLIETQAVVSLLVSGLHTCAKPFSIIVGELDPETLESSTLVAPDFDSFMTQCLDSLRDSDRGAVYWQSLNFPFFEEEQSE